jgi:PRTRC genetic system protein B
MQVETQIGSRCDFVLKTALLIYEDQVSRREQFATVHPVLYQGAEPQFPQLGPGTLLTTKFLEQLAQRLQRKAKAVVLPANILAYTAELLVWWTPPRLHRMFFSDGAEDRKAIDGQICPHPALVWKVHRGALYLRALAGAERPRAETMLMVAPYWNTEPSRGGVCEGNMPRPRETNVGNVLEWEEGFFNSRFSHPSGMGKLTTHPGSFIGLWTELAGNEQFPNKYLISAGQTLQEFVGEV